MAVPGLQWVATPPAEAESTEEIRVPPQPYTGPPSYPVPPRWGLPLLGWRRPRPLSTPVVGAAERMLTLAATAFPLLWLSAALAVATAAAEGWRYALLLDSRTDAVPATSLHVSDALVVTGGMVSLIAAALAGAVTLGWLVRACAAAAESAGVRPPRPAWQLVAGVLVPGVNLLLPGAVLAELEHTALRRDPGRRPRPSPLVAAWWVVWATGLGLGALTLLWGLRSGVQARADGVLLHLVTDLVAGVVAVVTIVVLRRLTQLLGPAQRWDARRMVVVRVGSDSAAVG